MVEPNSRHHTWGGTHVDDDQKGKEPPEKTSSLSYMFTLNAVAVCGFRERSIIGCV